MIPLLTAGKMMERSRHQVSFVEAGAAATGDTNNVLVPVPAGISPGNFLLLTAHCEDSGGVGAQTIDTPAGWNLIANIGSEGFGFAAFWRKAAGTEGSTVDVTYSSSDNGGGGKMFRFNRGSGIEAAGSAFDAGEEGTIEAINVTTTQAMALAVQVLCTHNAAAIGELSGESGANYQKALTDFSTTGVGTISLQVAEIPTPTAITGGTATAGASAGEGAVGFVILP